MALGYSVRRLELLRRARRRVEAERLQRLGVTVMLAARVANPITKEGAEESWQAWREWMETLGPS